MLQPETVTRDAEVVKPSALTSFLSGFLSKYATATESKVAKEGELQRKYPRPSGYNKYTYAEVAKHNTPEDCWLIVEDKVYDVSAMNHPGGEVVFSYGGRDATELFNVMHKNQPKVRAILKAYLIGEVAAPDQTSLLKDWNAMRKDFEARGLMDASALFYGRKLFELIAMISTAAWLNFTYPTSVLAMLASAFLAATYLYQCGWTQHDFQHNQVFRSHKLNALVGGWVISLGLGGSAHWWKTKHNQHHATPNKMHADTKAAVDPDIDTVPLIAWHEELVKQVPRNDRGLISVQHILVWPLLLVALLNWQAQSMIHAFSFPGIPAKTRRYEIGMMVTHQAYMAFISFFPLGWKMGLLHWVLTHAMAGFVTSFVFIQSHNGMEIYTDDKDFVTSQLVSTRNIHPGVVSDWIMGGLNYQIEHHLFPTMPRHSFSKIRKELMQFCARHGLPYESCTTWESTVKVYNALKGIAKLA